MKKLLMQRCIELASNGLGKTYPNPIVGAVIVLDNKIIGEGYHHQYGGSHAEVEAINSVEDKSLLCKSEIYVSLEPCSHFGKTPPCSDLIIHHKLKKVYVGCLDPNPMVAGKGIEKISKAGIEIEIGILEEECKRINRRFFTNIIFQRPYIILKWAQTLDLFIDFDRTQRKVDGINWISNEQCRILVHKWRSEEQAIMVGTNTAMQDNPKLNIRDWHGNQPLRVILDRNLRLSSHLNIFDRTQETIIYTEKDKKTENNLIYKNIEYSENLLANIMKDLHNRKICSVIIEGGAKLLNSFLNQNLWDEARVFTGSMRFVRGIKAPKLVRKAEIICSIDDTLLETFYNNSHGNLEVDIEHF